ncbi:putative La ribonucleoprotein [Giardia muris]|uniref:Putative La ribonucleoprotein n=1 Tax=Giardia muris TaxID=5742 RepID=A0A4Z1T2Z6_GIAMU|nr:putative La ribonucleoprotein [Giardia muris]|eukprot:TNJ27427.1 putative La ribonucleoprotein [Giardia muris]
MALPAQDLQLRNAITQLEYYFSNYNIVKDQFLIDEMRASGDDTVELAKVAAFPKLSAFGFTTEQLREAAKDSPVVEVTDDLRIRRRQPIPNNYNPEDLTLFVSGWPTGFAVDSIRQFFRDALGLRVEHVGLRYAKGKGRVFDGSTLLVFPDKETLQKAWEYFGSQETETPEALARAGVSREKDSSKYTADDAKDLLAIPLAEWKRLEKLRPVSEHKADATGEIKITRGLILKITGIGRLGFDTGTGTLEEGFKPASDSPADQAPSRDVIKTVFSEYGEIKFIDYTPGAETGYVRYSTGCPDATKSALAKYTTNKLILFGGECNVSMLEGDEETAYYLAIKQRGDSRTTRRQSRGRKA